MKGQKIVPKTEPGKNRYPNLQGLPVHTRTKVGKHWILVPVAIVSSPVMLKSSIVAVVSLGAENMDQVKDCDGQP